MERTDAFVGQRVYFGRPNGEKTLGEVVKVNRTKLKVRQLESRGQYRNHPEGAIWNVPLSFCTPEDNGRPSHVTKRPERRACLVNVITGKRTYGRPGQSGEEIYEEMANRY
jgi:hypothetical protein